MDTTQFVKITAAEYQRLLDGFQELSKLRAEFAYFQEHIARDIALDRERITELENKQNEHTSQQKNQGDILRLILAANNGKMLQTEAIKKMNISKYDFSRLLLILKNEIHVKPYYKDRRKNILELV